MEPQHEQKLVEDIRQWLRRENVYNARHDRETILKFLRGCKYQVDKAKTKMKNFYHMRRSTPELFHGRDPLLKNLETLLNAGAFFPLPAKSDEGHTVFIVKAGASNSSAIPMTDTFKIGIMSVDLMIELDDSVTRHGVRVITDLKGVGLHHALQMTPGLIRKITRLWQDCYTIRIHGIDFVNAPPGVDLILTVFRKFLSENLKRRLRTHGSEMSSLHEVIDPKLLPEEYGGSAGAEAAFIAQWKKKVQAHRRWFLQDETLV